MNDLHSVIGLKKNIFCSLEELKNVEKNRLLVCFGFAVGNNETFFQLKVELEFYSVIMHLFIYLVYDLFHGHTKKM